MEPEVSERMLHEDSRELPMSWTGSSSSSSDSVGDDGSSICSLPAEQLKPVIALLEALAVGGAGAGAGGAAARAAHAIASRHLVPKLPYLEPYMAPRHLVAVLAALLPGAGAAALQQSAHPYPGPSPPQRPSPAAAVLPSPSLTASAVDHLGRSGRSREESASPADQLAAVVKALCRRTDPRVFRSACCLLEAWHVLAAARAGGAVGTDDPRVTTQLMAPVFACVVRHVTMLGSAPEAARFVVSCALLSVYDKAALDAIAAPLVAALGSGGDGASSSMTRCRTTALTPTALAQLGWAVGQLGYANGDLLAAIQNQALALSAPSFFSNASLESYPHWQPSYTDDLRRGGGASPLAAAPAAAATAAVAAAAGLTSPPLLGPLELADVLWGLSVNQFRTHQGTEIRELYLRAASQGVVSIDDPRWLRLVQVHLLLLLGWAGGLGEAAAGQLRSGWFNALGYAWDRQAVARKGHLAGATGLPIDPDAATATFRQGVAAAVRDLLRDGIPIDGSGSGGGGGGGGRRGEWRLQPGFVWGMLQPSSDIRLTVPLLLRFRPEAVSLVVGNACGGGEWAIALDLVRCADEAIVSVSEMVSEPSRDTQEHDELEKINITDEDHPAGTATPAAAAATITGQHQSLPPPPPPPSPSPLPPQQQQQCEGAVEGGHLLGPARWRRLVLRRLGVVVKTVRQEEWERADRQERYAMLRRVLRL
ncbi:hypothetical protein Vretimale_17568 [Volvox reticuliferus]|nr:hypothetical protein Vretifemale_3446 [Volvox reticuliferus]GIM14760.1 hypothetical protein Vretimale_17568 [Volvox reticuliferus]